MGGIWNSILGWFSGWQDIFKALTSKVAMVFYIVVAVAVAGYWGYNEAKKAITEYNFSIREEIRNELNTQELKRAIEDQTAQIKTIQSLNESRAEALLLLMSDIEVSDEKYKQIERLLASQTQTAVSVGGDKEGPQPLSPYMQRMLELLEKAEVE